MLDYEPEGGERVGEQPAVDKPARRSRTTRRTSSPAPDLAVAPATPAPAEPATEAALPRSDEVVAAPRSSRRRRKAATEDTTAGEAEVGKPTTAGPQPEVNGEPPAAETPVKATRTRRRATRPAGEPEPVGVDSAATASPAEGAAGPVQSPTGPVEGAVGPSTPSLPDTSDDAVRAEPAAGDEAGQRRRRAALTAPTVLFMAPEPEVVVTRWRAAAEPPPVVQPAEHPAEVEESEPGAAVEAPRRRRRARRGEPVEEVEVTVEDVAAEPVDEEEEDEDEAGVTVRRRRRRGRRGRGRGRGTADETEEELAEPEAAAVEEPEEAEEEETGEDGVTRRRRRRRRKGAADVEVETDDGVHTVVRIREPRRVTDEVQGVAGSTRLEAKRQRRRDGREQRRTRPPILSEAEFLARREAVDRVMVVRQRGDRTQIAVLEDGVLVEHYVSRASSGTMAGNVYLGKVQNVLPSMEAAFVDIGRGRNAVLYAGEVNWDATGLEGRARSIEQALKSGDSVLVQVTKDPIGHKGARLTSHVAVSGRHLVYVPHGNASGISRKLPDNERKRLRDILKKLVPDGAGVIVRTAAEGASEDELARDIKRLQARWEDIQAKAAGGGAPVLLYEEPDLVIRVVRDLFNEDFRELVVQGDDAYDTIESYLAHVSPDLVSRLHRHTGVVDVFADKRIDEQILKALDRKVYLPSGGHLVIDRTEAMTVIDVNTGKYTGAGGNLEETVTRNNLEAAEEIVRQLRLRDVGGIVVIDFIDMVLESNRELVLRRLTECLGRDRTKHQVTEITSLGLVQMTRKRIGAGLLEAFSETCECCKGRGVIIHPDGPPAEKPRGGAGEKVRAVASASTPAAQAATPAAAASGGGRSRRRSAAPVTAEVEVTDHTDTMGYDLSRYEPAASAAVAATESTDAVSATEPAAPPAESQATSEPEPAAPAAQEPTAPVAELARLASTDDPDAAYGPGDDEPVGGRRRGRRGARR